MERLVVCEEGFLDSEGIPIAKENLNLAARIFITDINFATLLVEDLGLHPQFAYVNDSTASTEFYDFKR